MEDAVLECSEQVLAGRRHGGSRDVTSARADHFDRRPKGHQMSIARLANRALLSVSGAHAAEFLNGILATAVRDAPKRPAFSTILHAQARPPFVTHRRD